MSGPESGLAPLFAALGDPTRLALVSRLLDGRARSIAQLSDGMGQTRQGVSKHLRVLERGGVVTGRRIGRERRFRLQPGAIAQARDYLTRVSVQWDQAIDRLKSFVEED